MASAQAKLERIMPDTLRARVRAVDQTVRVDTLRTVAPQDDHALVILSSAAVAQRRVHLRYRVPDGADSEREFDPYGLAFSAGAWYAIGWCHLRAGMRSFRLDRILKAEARAPGFVRPPGFDALAYLRDSLTTMPRKYPIEVFLYTDLATASRHVYADAGVFEQREGGVLMRAHTDHIDWCAQALSRMPFEFEVRAPDALRDSLAALGRRLLRLSEVRNAAPA